MWIFTKPNVTASVAGLSHSRFELIPSAGTYFQTSITALICPDLNDVEMCQLLAEQHKIVAIPVSVFYQQPPKDLRLLRFYTNKMPH